MRRVDERREGGDAKNEGSFPGGIYDVTLMDHWLKRLLAVVEVPYRVRSGCGNQEQQQATIDAARARTVSVRRWSRILTIWFVPPIETC